jgi:hypothetical protein
MIENQSGEAICGIFIVPTVAPSWGFDDLHNGETVPDNGLRGFDLEQDTYNILVEDCDGAGVAIWWGVEIGDELITLTAGPRPGLEGDAIVTLVNDSEARICSVFIAQTTAEYWGIDWLDADEIVRADNSRTFRLPTGTYGMLAEDCDGEEIDSVWGITITDGYTWRVGGVDEGTVPPSGGAPSTGTGNGFIYVLSEIPVGGTCRISVWGQGLELLLDAGIGEPAAYEVPPGGYGWQAFLGWGQTDADAITVAPGGSCSFTCYRDGAMDYVSWGCNP